MYCILQTSFKNLKHHISEAHKIIKYLNSDSQTVGRAPVREPEYVKGGRQHIEAKILF